MTTPEEVWPLTGVLRLARVRVRAPEHLRAWWPRVAGRAVVETLGALRPHLDQSIQAGVADLEAAMAKHGNDHLVIFGYSQGAVIANLEKQKLAEQYPAGTRPPISTSC